MNLPSRRTASLIAIGLVFLAVFGWVVATQGPLAPIRVTTARAAEATLRPSLFGIGTLEARRSYGIGPTAAGRVAVVHVDHGDTVRAGQVLAEMDPVDLESREAASLASAARAAQLVAAAEAGRAEADSRARLARANADRFADLRRKNFVSQEAADAKAHEAAAAQAGAEAAEAALAAAKNETRRAQADRSALGQSRAHLRLRSPVDGVVSARLAEPGSTVVAGQAVVQVIDPATLWLRVRVDQGRSAGLAVGMPADVVLRSDRDRVLKGRVARLDLIGDATTEERVANVAFDVHHPNPVLGELAEARLHLPAIERALTVPAAAVKRLDGAEGVWRVQDGRASFQRVSTGVTSADGLTRIVAGLASGDEVIVHSQRPLSEGHRVRIAGALAGGSR